MPTIINADTSDGLKFTSDTSGEIKLQSGGTDIATVDSSGITAASGKVFSGDGSSLTGVVPDKLSTASGSAPSYSARAWVNFNGTGTVAINESGNVSSITDHATGAYTINFTTAMPDANYVAVGNAAQDTANNDVDILVTYSSNSGGEATYGVSNPTTSSFRIFITGAAGTVSGVDSSIVTYAVFR